MKPDLAYNCFSDDYGACFLDLNQDLLFVMKGV